jgi:hypothetical protein
LVFVAYFYLVPWLRMGWDFFLLQYIPPWCIQRQLHNECKILFRLQLAIAWSTVRLRRMLPGHRFWHKSSASLKSVSGMETRLFSQYATSSAGLIELSCHTFPHCKD